MFRLISIFIISFSAIHYSAGLSEAASYKTCVGGTSVQGKLFALVYKNRAGSRAKCWNRINRGTKISKKRLVEKGDSFQFTYIFPQQSGKRHAYDRLFSVLVREIRKEGEVSDAYISLARDSIRTLCSVPGRKRVARNWKRFFREFPGRKFNRAHSDSVTLGRLTDFHVAFVNAQNRCVRSDDMAAGRRKSFHINGVRFPDVPEIRRLAGLYRFLESTQAKAFYKSKYRKHRVRIRKGTISRTGMLSANFFVTADTDADLRVQDLASSASGRSSLRRPFRFKIR